MFISNLFDLERVTSPFPFKDFFTYKNSTSPFCLRIHEDQLGWGGHMPGKYETLLLLHGWGKKEGYLLGAGGQEGERGSAGWHMDLE